MQLVAIRKENVSSVTTAEFLNNSNMFSLLCHVIAQVFGWLQSHLEILTRRNYCRRMKKLVENHWFRGSTHFHSKNVGEPIEYSRRLPLPCFNKFVLTQKNFNCFVYKTIPALPCKDRRLCPGEGHMFWSTTSYWSRPMLFEKVEKRRIITFYFKTSTVDVGEWIQPQQHWSKQRSKVVTPQESLFSIIQIFAKVFCRLYHLPVK